MVFYYTIRGGQCLNEHSHIHLTPQDIICYVGRDKHENEHLIKYGWPGDIWFHVDGLSSAHVYFRLKNVTTVSSIPLDDLPPDAVYDMMQICKNNSISGSKLASCKMVYTPHANLKKNFDMEVGAVTYHDTKQCRYARCEKDRKRVRELEKTKSDDVDVDYYQEMKDNERRIIERKKRLRNQKRSEEENGDGGDGGGLYDPMLEDLQATKMKAGRQGDKASGLDAGLAALEELSFAPEPAGGSNGQGAQQSSASASDNRPVYMQEEDSRQREPSADVRFLRERGYPSSEATAACMTSTSRIGALRKLYTGTDDDAPSEETPEVVPEEVRQARVEEKEVLQAMFGYADENDEASPTFANMEDETIFDATLPITGYEPPGRYGNSPPPLMMEVYVDGNMAPLYPNEPPILAVVGGGLPEVRLRELTKRFRTEANERCAEDPGEPQIFNLLAMAGEAAEAIVQEEAEELAAERKQRLEEERAAAAKLREEQGGGSQQQPHPNAFTSEAQRRAYAKEVAARAGNVPPREEDGGKSKAAPKYNAKTGVSDRNLIDDLFS
mmetsp:Transcript_30649/g.52337  ORF Transcript_30649/g.52337 Transcript_30649/m.52337 type:complete len:554 (+) Transcript_30649:233-1894(+)